MASADDRRPVDALMPQHSRMDDDAMRKRSDAFRAATQGGGKQWKYGTGNPDDVPKPKKRKVAKP